MLQNKSFWQHPVVFFITHSCILAGMMLVFTLMANAIALYTAPMLFNIDIATNPDILSDVNNPQSLAALKYIQVLSSVGMFLGPAWHLGKALNLDPTEFLKINRRLAPREILWSTLLVFTLMPFISWLVYANTEMGYPSFLPELEQWSRELEQKNSVMIGAFLKADTYPMLLANLFVIAAVPAITEEFFFRGALQNLMRMVFRNKHISVWVVAIIFSLFHADYNGLLARIALGAVLGYAYLFTGNLWVSILIHLLNNAFAVVCSYTPVKNQLPEIMQDGYVFESWYINLGSALISLAILWTLRQTTFKRVWYNGE